MLKKLFITLVCVFIIYDTFRSFNQHLHMTLDGDLAFNVLPADEFKKAMKDPFAFSAVFNDEHYLATNRAFAHWTMYIYFQSVPFVFQEFCTPLDSIYLSSALAKILFQLLIAYMLVIYAKPKIVRPINLLLGLSIILPMFQTGGFNSQMGIIDQSITYSFFYALPVGLLLVFFYPFYRYFVFGEDFKFTFSKHFIWCALVVLLSFNGPLTAAIVITLIPIIFGLHFFNRLKGKKSEKIDITAKFYLIAFGLLSLYSIYAGTFNSANTSGMSLELRYLKLANGLSEMFIGSMAFPLIIGFISINYIIMWRHNSNLNINNVLLPILIFCVFYILLLPLGGYRVYRPNVLRNDTGLPIIISILYLFLNSTLAVLTLMQKHLRYYSILLISILLFFHFSDGHISSRNTSEKKAIMQIATSENNTVVINDYCTIMSFKPITDSLQSAVNTQMLQKWGVLDRPKLYYQKY